MFWNKEKEDKDFHKYYKDAKKYIDEFFNNKKQ